MIPALLLLTMGWVDGLEATRLGAAPPAGLLARTERLDLRAPGAAADVFLQTGLLAAMNRAGVTPEDAQLGLQKVRSGVRGRRGADRWVLTLDGSGRTLAILVELSVPVRSDLDGGSGRHPGRLGPLDAVVNRLRSLGARPSERDERGNVFGWQGRLAGGRLWAWYDPSRDRVTLLVYP